MKTEKVHARSGDRRVIKKFALFPITITEFNPSEQRYKSKIRWLERVRILQVFVEPLDGRKGYWVNWWFLEPEDNEEDCV
jgi:hypothetical protein